MFEKVNPSHPDKVADRIAGALVDIAYKKNDNPKIAVEVLIGHGNCTVIIETSESISNTEIEEVVERIAGKQKVNAIVVKQDVNLANNQVGGIRCGDNGIFKGVEPTKEQIRLTEIAGYIYNKVPYDGKYIIDTNGLNVNATICQSHINNEGGNEIRKYLENMCGINGSILINPLGEWTGGPDVDCGATNRKLGSDMGDAVTGGGLHGKDLSKSDVSVNIWCHIMAPAFGGQLLAKCSIGDDNIGGHPYADIVAKAREYIDHIGGFEKFAEWGLIRPSEKRSTFLEKLALSS